VDVALASQADPVVVVLGHQATACQAVLGDRPVQVVINSDWAQGQSSSVKAGLAALPHNISAVLFLLADQPGVTPVIINALIARYRTTLAPVVWPEYKEQRGNPVLFDRVTFPELMRLSGDTGGRPVLRAHAQHAERVSVSDPGVVFDIDTPEEYAKASAPSKPPSPDPI
jgi:molybdenum cofactor cytidylyltransferase